MWVNVARNAGGLSGNTKKLAITLNQKAEVKNQYYDLIKEYGDPEPNAFGIKCFEFVEGRPQFVLEAETQQPVLRNECDYKGVEAGRHFYLKKGKKMSRLKEYKPSWI